MVMMMMMITTDEQRGFLQDLGTREMGVPLLSMAANGQEINLMRVKQKAHGWKTMA